MKKLSINLRQRKYIYNLAIAGLLVAAAYGLIEADKVPVLEALALAVVGLARANARD